MGQFSVTDPSLSPESMAYFLAFLCQAMMPFISLFLDIAKTLLPILFSLSLAREALNISQGKEHKLIMVFVRFFVVSILLLSFSPGGTSFAGGQRFTLKLGGTIFNIPNAAIKTFYKVSDKNLEDIKEFRKSLVSDQSWVVKAGMSIVTFLAKFNLVSILAKILYLCSNMIGLVVFLSAAFAFYMAFLVGPLAIVSLMDESLSIMFKNWLRLIISYPVIFVVISIALDVNMKFQCTAVEMSMIEQNTGFWGSTKLIMYLAALSFANFYAALKIGPILFKVGDGKSLMGK